MKLKKEITTLFKALLIFSAAVFFPVVSSAQKHYIGLKGGVNLSYMNTNSKFLKDAYSHRNGLNLGITYDYRINDKFFAGAEALYNQRGYKINITITDMTGKELARQPVEYKYDYFSFPLKGGYTYGKKLFGSATVALVPSVVSKAVITSPVFGSNGNVIYTSTFNVTKTITNFDFGARIEISGGYMLMNNKLKAIASLAYQQSFTNICNKDFNPGLIMRYYGILPSLSVQYAIR